MRMLPNNSHLNKLKVPNKYLNRVWKIWWLELLDNDSFAVLVMTSIIAIVNWTLEKIYNFDVSTRKTMTLKNNVYKNSDANLLCI